MEELINKYPELEKIITEEVNRRVRTLLQGSKEEDKPDTHQEEGDWTPARKQKKLTSGPGKKDASKTINGIQNKSGKSLPKASRGSE